MKTLMVVILCLCLVVALWLFQINYMENSMNNLLSILTSLEKDVINDNWDDIEEGMDNFSDLWKEYKKVYSLFIDEHLLLCIDSFFSQAEAYVIFKEKADLLSILHSTKHELTSIYERELLTLCNII